LRARGNVSKREFFAPAPRNSYFYILQKRSPGESENCSPPGAAQSLNKKIAETQHGTCMVVATLLLEKKNEARPTYNQALLTQKSIKKKQEKNEMDKKNVSLIKVMILAF
jgi:hypothetical protein